MPPYKAPGNSAQKNEPYQGLAVSLAYIISVGCLLSGGSLAWDSALEECFGSWLPLCRLGSFLDLNGIGP